MTPESFSFRKALEELKYIQSKKGFPEAFFQKIIDKMKEYKIPVVCVDEIYLCLKEYHFVKTIYRIHVSYDQKGGDYKQRIYDIEVLDLDEATDIMKQIELYLEQEKFDFTDVTDTSVKKDPYIKKMIKVKIIL